MTDISSVGGTSPISQDIIDDTAAQILIQSQFKSQDLIESTNPSNPFSALTSLGSVPLYPPSKYPSAQVYLKAISEAISKLKALLYENDDVYNATTAKLDRAHATNAASFSDLLEGYLSDWEDWENTYYQPVTDSQNSQIGNLNNKISSLNTDITSMPSNTDTFNTAATLYNTQATNYNNSLSLYNNYISNLSDLQAAQLDATNSVNTAQSNYDMDPSPENLATLNEANSNLTAANNAVNNYVASNTSLVSNYSALASAFPGQQAAYQAALTTYNAQISAYNAAVAAYNSQVTTFNSSVNNGVSTGNAHKPSGILPDIPTVASITTAPYSSLSSHSTSLTPPVAYASYTSPSTLSSLASLSVPTEDTITHNFYTVFGASFLNSMATFQDARDTADFYNTLAVLTLRSPSIVTPDAYVQKNEGAANPNAATSSNSVSSSGASTIDLSSTSATVALDNVLAQTLKDKGVPATAAKEALGLITLFANSLLNQAAAVSGLIGIANVSPSTTSNADVSQQQDISSLIAAIAFLRKALTALLSPSFTDNLKSLLEKSSINFSDQDINTIAAALTIYISSQALLNLAAELKDPSLVQNIFQQASEGTALAGVADSTTPSIPGLLTNPVIQASLQANLNNQLSILGNINNPLAITNALNSASSSSSIEDFQAALTANLQNQGIPSALSTSLSDTAASLLQSNLQSIPLDTPITPQDQQAILASSSTLSSLTPSEQQLVNSVLPLALENAISLRFLQEDLFKSFILQDAIPAARANFITDAVLLAVGLIAGASPLGGIRGSTSQGSSDALAQAQEILKPLPPLLQNRLFDLITTYLQVEASEIADVKESGLPLITNPTTNINLKAPSTEGERAEELQDVRSLPNVLKQSIQAIIGRQDARLDAQTRELIQVFVNPDRGTIQAILQRTNPGDITLIPREGGGVATSSERISSLPV